jgi:hypothetical protein
MKVGMRIVTYKSWSTKMMTARMNYRRLMNPFLSTSKDDATTEVL